MGTIKDNMEVINTYNSPDYKRARKAYCFQRIFEYFVFALVCDPYLSKLLTTIGVPDGIVGVIGTFVSLAAMFELMSIVIVAKMKNVKRTVITGHLISQLSYGSMFVIPFMPVSVEVKTWLVTISLFMGYAFFYMISSVLYKWKTSFISPDNRGSFVGGVESISVFVGMVFAVVMGAIIDYFEASGNINVAFLFLALSIFVFTAGNIVSLAYLKNKDISEFRDTNKEKQSFKDVIDNTIKNKSYLYVVAMTALYNIATGFSSGFMGVYKINELMMSMTLIQVISVGGSILRMILAKPIGIYSDRTSCVKGMKLAYTISIMGSAFAVFTTKNTWWLSIISALLGSAAFVGINVNNFNVIYDYVDEKYYVQALAIKNSIAGILGFGASIVGGRILTYIQQNGNAIFGISMYAQQFLSLITVIVLGFSVIFIIPKIEKQTILRQ